MLIPISGSQGSGKSTVLQKLKEMGQPIIERKTARSILADWDVSLDVVNQDLDLKIAFQDELLRRKAQDEIEAALSDKVYFTERTFADLFTYALIAFGQYNKYDEWLDNYYNKCKEQFQFYQTVFYLKGGYFDVQADGVRSINKHYSRLMDKTMLDFTEQMMYNQNLEMIDIENLDERVEYIWSVAKHEAVIDGEK